MVDTSQEHSGDQPIVATAVPAAGAKSPATRRGRSQNNGVAAVKRMPRPPKATPTPPALPPMPDRSPAPDHLIVGRVVAAHGMRGEFRMAVITNHPQHLPKIRTLYLGEAREPFRVARLRVNPQGKEAVVKLTGLDNPEDAAARRGELVWVALADAPPLPAGEYYHYQLIGIDVVDESGAFLGRLAEIIETGANEVYVVRGPAGELLLPVIDGVILSVDPAAGQMLVRPPEYL